MTWDLEKHAAEVAEAAKAAGMKVLAPEEDEPDFGPLLDKAKARVEAGGEDAPLIRELLDMIDHLHGEIDAMENHISDYGPPFEDPDD